MTKPTIALLSLLALAACGGGGGGSAPGPLPQTITAVAVATPAPQVYVALGDSITHGWDGTVYLTAQAYPDIVASALGATLTNLAIDGTPSGGVLATEVPSIPTNATVVSVYTGIIDENQTIIGIGGYDVATTARNYAANVQGIIAGIHGRAPSARVILVAPPNLLGRSVWVPFGTPALLAMVNAMKGALVATGLPVVDLECEPAMYDPANFGVGAGDTQPGTNLHPLASGQAAIATDFLRVIQRGATYTPCSYEAAL